VLDGVQVYVNSELDKDLEGSGCDATEVVYQHFAECLFSRLMVASERKCLVVILWCKNAFKEVKRDSLIGVVMPFFNIVVDWKIEQDKDRPVR